MRTGAPGAAEAVSKPRVLTGAGMEEPLGFLPVDIADVEMVRNPPWATQVALSSFFVVGTEAESLEIFIE